MARVGGWSTVTTARGACPPVSLAYIYSCHHVGMRMEDDLGPSLLARIEMAIGVGRLLQRKVVRDDE